MGLCVSYDEMVVGYKGEDYIRDVLRAFKSRQFPIETLQEQLYSLKEQSDRLTFIYESIVNKYDNKFQKMNETIINIINNTKQFDNDQFTVIKLITVSLKANNKIYFIKDFFKVKNFDTLYSICKIIWKVNLIGFTQSVYDNIEEKELKKQIKYLVEEVFNETNFSSFISEIEGQWKLLISKSEEYNLENCTDFWYTLSTKYDYCFNAIELRHYFYLKYTYI